MRVENQTDCAEPEPTSGKSDLETGGPACAGSEVAWNQELLSGKVASVAELAKREKLHRRYVARIVRLAFLKPNVMQVTSPHLVAFIAANKQTFGSPKRVSGELVIQSEIAVQSKSCQDRSGRYDT